MKQNKSKKGLASKIGATAILVIAAFAFIYVPGILGDSTGSIVYGKYDGQKITDQTPAFYSAVQQIYAQAEQNGEVITIEKYISVLQEAFESAVISLAFENEVNDSNYVPTDATITARMVEYISSQTDDPVAYVNSMTNTDRNRLYDAAAEDLIISKYSEDFVGSRYTGLYGIKSSSAEEEFIKNMNTNQRSFDVVSFNKSSYPETELVAYGNKNADLFITYNLSAITTADEDTLKTTLDQLNKNEITFEDAVINYSTKSTTDENGLLLSNLGYQLKSTLTSDADFATVTGLKAGEISGVIKTYSGYAIFRGESAPVAPDFTNESVLDAVSLYMSAYESGLIEDYFLTLAEDFASDAVSVGFNEAAASYGITPVTTSSFPINYGESAILGYIPSEFAGVQNNESFFKTAFTLTEGQISAPIVVGNNIVVIKLNEEVTANPVDDFSYMYYSSAFDQASLYYSTVNSDKVENRVTDAYFEQLSANASQNS